MNRDKLEATAKTLQIGSYQRHVFLCVGESCCTHETGLAAWEALKKELKIRGLTPGTDQHTCYRTKVGCLRVCQDGPIAVVYPEGTFYAGLTAEQIPEFVQKHLVEDQPIEEWIFARNPVASQDKTNSAKLEL